MGWKRGAKSLFLEVHASSVAAELHGDQVTHKHLTFALLYLNQASASPKVIWRACDTQVTATSDSKQQSQALFGELIPYVRYHLCKRVFSGPERFPPDALGHQVKWYGSFRLLTYNV